MRLVFTNSIDVNTGLHLCIIIFPIKIIEINQIAWSFIISALGTHRLSSLIKVFGSTSLTSTFLSFADVEDVTCQKSCPHLVQNAASEL